MTSALGLRSLRPAEGGSDGSEWRLRPARGTRQCCPGPLSGWGRSAARSDVRKPGWGGWRWRRAQCPMRGPWRRASVAPGDHL